MHGEEDVPAAVCPPLSRSLNINAYIPNYLETVELLPQARRRTYSKMFPGLQAWEVQKLWQEFQHDYSRRLELAILDEDAAQHYSRS